MALTPLQRRIWYLRVVAGWPFADIGRELNMRRQSAYVVFRRTQRKVETLLKEAEETRRLLPVKARRSFRFFDDRTWKEISRARRYPR